MHEDMKKLMANNLELATHNGNLQQELNLACKDTLLLWKEALVQKKADIDMNMEISRAGGAHE